MLVYKVELLGLDYVQPEQFGDLLNAVNLAKEWASCWKDKFVNIYIRNVFRKTQKLIGVGKYDEKSKIVSIQAPYKGGR